MASKYQPLWIYIRDTNKDDLVLSFNQIEEILGFPIDHSFLTYKKELIEYGFEVKKISIKNKMLIVGNRMN